MIKDVVIYGRIVCVVSFGLFGIPEMGIAGAAIATVAGQIVAALIVMKKGFRRSPSLDKYGVYIKNIFWFGIPNILMQSAYTFYILGLNLILSGFSDQAVTALGLYYKWQTFFFIPLGFLFSRFGLDRFWLTFPVTELITTLVGFIFYRQFLKKPYAGTFLLS